MLPDDAPPSHPKAKSPTVAAAGFESTSFAPTPPLLDAARSWAALVDSWWRQQSAVLPPDLKRAMTATLDQSKALVEIACRQTAEKPVAPDAAHGDALGEPSVAPDEETPNGFGLWQPVVDAFQICQEKMLAAQSGEAPAAASEAMTEYQDATRAYLGEFLQLNTEISSRIDQALAKAEASPDLRTVHELVLDKAEEVYLERVSRNTFARRQARFLNALLRLRQDMAVVAPDAGSESP